MNLEYLERAKEKIPEPESLTQVIAVRSKELAQGARPMIKCKCENFLDVALLEVAEGLLSIDLKPTKKVKKAIL